MKTPKENFAALTAALEQMERLDAQIDITPEGDAAVEAFDKAIEDAMEAYRQLRDAPDVLNDMINMLAVMFGVPE